MHSQNSNTFLAACASPFGRMFLTLVFMGFSFSACAFAVDSNAAIRQDFLNPPTDCWPHTYWFWPGNAVTKEEITWELEQMHEKGIGGVLLNSAFGPIYEKGNLAYLSDEHLQMLRHAVLEAKRLGMEVILNFAHGWVFGGHWVAPEDRSQSLVPAFIDLQGPRTFSAELPKFKKAGDHRGEIRIGDIPDGDKLVAVVAGQVSEDKIIESTLIDLTPSVKDGLLRWQVPAGFWRLMCFWLKFTGQKNVDPSGGQDGWCVDHFSRTAMQRYCEYLGGKFYNAFGEEFGKTVEALHCDSFELASLPNGFYWSDGMMAEFRQAKGYDLAKYLPAVWWDMGEVSVKIRYEVNEFLHNFALKVFFQSFLDWCHSHHVKASMEPYGFTNDILQGAGLVDLPFMEVTPGEKDAVPWFDNRIGPRKYVASGSHLYGRNTIGVEAYTYTHWEIYRATLEELKIASDGFLCAGANKFYNHLYGYTPERDAAVSRALPWEAMINHTNIWWPYYPLLSKYLARCCYLLRQGDFVSDVAVYSPLANQWTLNVMNSRKWTREFDWGELGKLLHANGYSFDLINDDVLQHRAQVSSGKIKVGVSEYSILILPNIKALPLATLSFIREYVRAGGVVIAVERVPDSSVGFVDYQQQDAKVKAIVEEMFQPPKGANGTGPKDYGKGRTYYIKKVMHRQDVLDWRSSVMDPFVNTLRQHVVPDFTIDFVSSGLRENAGLSFIHRRMGEKDIYFVSNIQDQASDIPLTFRVTGKIPWHWNPYNGQVRRVFHYREAVQGIEVPMHLMPYESMFLLFEPGTDAGHVEKSNLLRIDAKDENAFAGWADKNGSYYAIFQNGQLKQKATFQVSEVPAEFAIAGKWKLTLTGQGFPRYEKELTRLESWTEDSASGHFSGTGTYETEFFLPSQYIADDIELELDLGQVGNIAKVELNSKELGTCWMRGQRLNITGVAHAGRNELGVSVTNTLINRLAEVKDPPPVPEELVAHYGSGNTAYSAGFRGPMGFKPLPLSGLMGPVKIIPAKKVHIEQGWR